MKEDEEQVWVWVHARPRCRCLLLGISQVCVAPDVPSPPFGSSAQLSGNAARDNKKTCISPHHIQLEVRNDEEVSALPPPPHSLPLPSTGSVLSWPHILQGCGLICHSSPPSTQNLVHLPAHRPRPPHAAGQAAGRGYAA